MSNKLDPDQVDVKKDYIHQKAIERKRFRPPFHVNVDCPECGNQLKSQYIDRPKLGETVEWPFHCKECKEHYFLDVQFDMTLTLEDA